MKLCRNFHWIASLILLSALVPISRAIGLHLHYDFAGLLMWTFALAVQSTLLAAVIYFAASPCEVYKKLTRRGESTAFPAKVLAAGFVPMAYFAASFTLVLTYNDVIAITRFDGSADIALARIDSSLLMGHSVLSFAHWILIRHPAFVGLAEFLYLGVFPIGACMLMVGLGDGFARSMQFVGALLTAYYIALLCFFLVPAAGPFVADHSSLWPKSSHVYELQNGYAVLLSKIREGYRPAKTGGDYFIALPCMHIVQPLIALWFLRKRKGIARILAIYCVLVLPAIFLLEEHYFIDVVASLPVAALAITMVEGFPARIRLVPRWARFAREEGVRA